MFNFTRPKVWLALIFSALAIAFWWWLEVGRQREKAWSAIPENCSILLKFNGLTALDSVFHSNNFKQWQPVFEASFFSQIQTDLQAARQIFFEKNTPPASLAGAEIVAGLSLHDADSMHAVFALRTPRDFDVSVVLKNKKHATSTFRGQSVFHFQLSENQRFAVAQRGRLLVFSSLAYLVEEALTAAETGENVLRNAGFLKSKNDDGAGVRLTLNVEQLAEQTGSKMASRWQHLPSILRENFQWLSFNLNDNPLVFKALSSGKWIDAKDLGASGESEIFSILPDNTAFLLHAGFANAPLFSKKMFDAPNANFSRFVEPWLGSELAFVLTEPFSTDLAEEQFFVLAAKNLKTADACLRAFGEQRGLLKSYDYQTFTIRQFASPSFLEGLIEPENAIFRTPVCALVGQHVVVAGTTSALERWIDKFVVSQNLSNDPNFLQLRQRMPRPPGLGFAFVEPRLLGGFLPNFFKKKYETGVGRCAEGLKKTGLWGFDFSAGERPGELKIEARSQNFSIKTADAAGILWKTPLSAELIAGPFLLENEAAGSAKIFSQDGSLKLFCLDANGEIRWRRQLEQPLRSQVQGFDFFKNGTECYLFNTAEKIYLLDADGEDVEGFPLRLASPATNAVALVNFSESADYAFFIACENGNLYGFDAPGRPLPGWNPQPSVGRLDFPLLHFQFEKKDYLVALNRAGRLQVFARNGDLRFPPRQFSGRFLSPPQVDVGRQSPRIVCGNAEGRIFVCNLLGETFGLSTGTGSGSGDARFVFAPLVGDERLDYLTFTQNEVRILGYAGQQFKPFSSFDFSEKIDSAWVFAGPKNESLLGIFSRKKRLIFAATTGGKVLPGFPLAGSTPFCVGDIFDKKNGRVLVVGFGHQVYAYSIL